MGLIDDIIKATEEGLDLVAPSNELIGKGAAAVGDALFGGVGALPEPTLQQKAAINKVNSVSATQLNNARNNLKNMGIPINVSDDRLRVMVVSNPSLGVRFTSSQIEAARANITNGTSLPGWAQPSDKDILKVLTQSSPEQVRAITTPITNKEFDEYRVSHGLSGGASVDANDVIQDRIQTGIVAGTTDPTTASAYDKYAAGMSAHQQDIVQGAADKARGMMFGDTNGDGKLSKSEALLQYDKNHDGFITRDEVGNMSENPFVTGGLGYFKVGDAPITANQGLVDKALFEQDMARLQASNDPKDQQTLEQINNFFKFLETASPEEKQQFMDTVRVSEYLKSKNGSTTANAMNGNTNPEWQTAASMTPEERQNILNQINSGQLYGTNTPVSTYQHIKTAAQVQADMDRAEIDWMKQNKASGAVSSQGKSTKFPNLMGANDGPIAGTIGKKVPNLSKAVVGNTDTPDLMTGPSLIPNGSPLDKSIKSKTTTTPSLIPKGSPLDKTLDNSKKLITDKPLVAQVDQVGKTIGKGILAGSTPAVTEDKSLPTTKTPSIASKVLPADQYPGAVLNTGAAGKAIGSAITSYNATSPNQVKIDQINSYNVPQSVKNSAIAEVNKGNTATVANLIKFFNGGMLSGSPTKITKPVLGGTSVSNPYSSNSTTFPPVVPPKVTTDPVPKASLGKSVVF
ncbi:hypothetical protein KC930_02845 [Candidatus Saccharibacteria bacterium]|nr:hypothetical protein [Candidatus Saccharibacteria bacterium]